MRKKIILAFGAATISLIAVKALAGTLLASPGYVAPGCSWNNLGGGYFSGVTVSVTGLYCAGTGPILVQTVVMPPSGTATCTLAAQKPNDYTYSSTLVCNNYSVSTK